MSSYSPISPDERSRYESIFYSLNPSNGKINGSQTRSVFLKSNLPSHQLSQIWSLSDMDGDGQLDIDEFVIAMRLVYDTLNGSPIPSSLPVYFIPPSKQMQPAMSMSSAGMTVPSYANSNFDLGTSSGASSLGYNQTNMPSASFGSTLYQPSQPPQLPPPMIEFTDNFDWYISPSDRLKYEDEYKKLPVVDGLISKNEMQDVFYLSRRPQEEFKAMWNVVDIHRLDAITKDQFIVFMHIINTRRRGKPLPSYLPPDLILQFKKPQKSTSFTNLSKSGSAEGLSNDEYITSSRLGSRGEVLGKGSQIAEGYVNKLTSPLMQRKGTYGDNPTNLYTSKSSSSSSLDSKSTPAVSVQAQQQIELLEKELSQLDSQLDQVRLSKSSSSTSLSNTTDSKTLESFKSLQQYYTQLSRTLQSDISSLKTKLSELDRTESQVKMLLEMQESKENKEKNGEGHGFVGKKKEMEKMIEDAKDRLRIVKLEVTKEKSTLI